MVSHQIQKILPSSSLPYQAIDALLGNKDIRQSAQETGIQSQPDVCVVICVRATTGKVCDGCFLGLNEVDAVVDLGSGRDEAGF